jgi:hypothetical protein
MGEVTDLIGPRTSSRGSRARASRPHAGLEEGAVHDELAAALEEVEQARAAGPIGGKSRSVSSSLSYAAFLGSERHDRNDGHLGFRHAVARVRRPPEGPAIVPCRRAT